jgi:hypothetical protein
VTGATARKYASAKIRKFGQQISVTRPSTGTVQPLYCLGMRDKLGAAQMMGEGGYNVGDAQPHILVFEGGSDVAVGDLIPWAGATYRAAQVQPTMLLGVEISRTAYGNRED